MNFADHLRSTLKTETFSEEDLYVALPNKSEAAMLSGVSRSLRSKDIQKLKRGLYIFGDRLRRGDVHKFKIANRLYSPSYVSYESALSFHGLIPEAVFVTTSACVQSKNKQFQNHFGDFSFEHVRCQPFLIGVEKYESAGNSLVANPLKALFDLIYKRRKNYAFIGDLEDDLRVDLEDLARYSESYSHHELAALAASYQNQRMVRFLVVLMKGLK